jgi:ribonuclease P protein component
MMRENYSYGLSKKERLYHQKLIEKVFKTPFVVKSYPLLFSFYFEETPNEIPNAILFSVSKRKFKRAVDRNRIKRLLREVYRLNKNLLINPYKPHKNLIGGLVYTGKELLDYKSVHQSFAKLVNNYQLVLKQIEEKG